MSPFGPGAQLKPLAAPELEDAPVHGVDAANCFACAQGDDAFLWTDEHWRLGPLPETPFPSAVMLHSRRHVRDFLELTDDEQAGFGRVLARAERALLGIGQPGTPTSDLQQVGRVHVNRWGDGGHHLHVWLLPRPLGATQLRGYFLTMWMPFMTASSEEHRERAYAQIAAAMRDGR